MTHAIYNSGQHLYADGMFQAADTYYEIPWWVWLPFARYSTLQYISGVMALRSFGHNPDRLATILMGSHRVLTQHSPCRMFTIPPLCIQYVAEDRNGRIVDSLLVCQPLPMDLMDHSLL